jgi:cyclopropane fatty-acyl-phospholipid synthase-like methyltransferase
MSRLIDVLKWGSTLGGGEQNFLGAKWVTTVLRHAPESKRRAYALKLLSLSPHYFLDHDDPKYAGMSDGEYFEATFANVRESREKIYDQILNGRINDDDVVADYGCGPGFLARVLARHAKQVFAFDISTGVLACARILNTEDNLTYLTTNESGLSEVADASVDVVVSFAMVQHISDAIYDLVMDNVSQKLKSGGRLILHIQLPEDGWRTEDEWRSDTSVKGRIKYKYGLHCFARSEAEHVAMAEKHGFTKVEIVPVSTLVSERFDDVCEQHLLTATRV